MTTRHRLLLLSILATPAAAEQDPEALLVEARCNACHQIEMPMLGPSYEAIAERYRGDDSAADAIFQRMRAGSQGIWGPVPMPPVPEDTLSDAQLEAVTAWILSR